MQKRVNTGTRTTVGRHIKANEPQPLFFFWFIYIIEEERKKDKMAGK